jgi:hypothetical protein
MRRIKLGLHVAGSTALAVALAACSSVLPPPAAGEPPRSTDAHALVMAATACWMGGLWSDSLGETGGDRDAGIERRCNAVLRDVDVASPERARAVAERMPPAEQDSTSAASPQRVRHPEEAYYPMRAVEPHVVGAIARAVQDAAEGDPSVRPHARELVALLLAVADAARETIHARRAADVVKGDVSEPPPPETRRDDKRAAAAWLRQSGALSALLRLDAGPYTADARAIALLLALDRMEIARGLPKHLKLYAVGHTLRDLFGVAPPAVSEDAPVPVPTGLWLAYLTDVAAAAGHEVPGDAHDPQNREPLAWTGVLEGFADKLRREAADSDARHAPLVGVERSVIQRLDDEYRNERTVYEAHAVKDR